MGLCGGYRCGCGVTSTPATSGAINGELPTIDVSGSGEPGDPYDLSFNDQWTTYVAEGIIRPLIFAGWERTLFQSIPSGTLTTINYDSVGPSAPTLPPGEAWVPSGQPVTIPAGFQGVYLMTATVTYVTTVLGAHRMVFSINGGTRIFPIAGASGTSVQAGTIATGLSAGDTVEVRTAHANGGAVNALARFEIRRLPADNPIIAGP